MPIIVNEKDKTFTLQTKNTSYQLKVDRHGFLLHLYYGSKVEDQNLDYLVIPVDRGFSGNPYEAGEDRAYSLDTLPLEYPTDGVGDYRINAVLVLSGGANKAVDLRFHSFKQKMGKYQLPGQPALYDETGQEAETLEIVLKDSLLGLEVTLLYGIFPADDIITRAILFCNASSLELNICRAKSASLDIPYGEWDFVHFHGRHNMERIFERNSLPHGITSFGSRRGTSSHQHNPFIIICDKKTTEFTGICYGMNLVYSGSFKAEAEIDQTGLLRLNMGINDDGFNWRLKPGEIFMTPEAVLSFSKEGFSKLSHNYHNVYRNCLCRGSYKQCRRPIVINNWEATYFDFDSKKLLEIAKEAALLGIDMLVMDDGWFGKRSNDKSSLGDWVVNDEKLPGGLKPLVDSINGLGMKFGIWFEPEMVSEDSDLCRNHPDWVLKVPGREPVRSRSQLVLDISREDVRDYLIKSISKVLDSANIEYVKWDMNRSISDWFSNKLPDEQQGELMHRYVLGLYSLLEHFVQKYPHILFEGCSGGGGRFDPAMLYYHPLIWCSDNTDAIERLKIQYGTSFAYPVAAVSSHVSAVPNHQTGRVTSLKTRAVVAMSGNFGYELNPALLSEEEKEEIKTQICLFKKYHDILHNGLYYRLSDPFKERFSAWMMVLGDGSEALLNIVVNNAEANPKHLFVKLKGLNENDCYFIDDKKYTGASLMNAGFAIKNACEDYLSLQFYLKRE